MFSLEQVYAPSPRPIQRGRAGFLLLGLLSLATVVAMVVTVVRIGSAHPRGPVPAPTPVVQVAAVTHG